MSYNKSKGGQDYRGRAKNASKYRGKHSKSSAPAEDQLTPLDTGVINTHVESYEFGGNHERAVDNHSEDLGQQAPESSESARGGQHALDEEPSDTLSPVSAEDIHTSTGEPEKKADSLQASSGENASPDTAQYSREGAHYTHRKGANSSRAKKGVLAVVAVLAVAIFAFAGAALAMWQNAQQKIELPDESIKDELTPVVSNAEPYWFLILGSDSRSEGTGGGDRADVILLARIDEPNKQVTLVSIPRDSKVTIDGTTQKINAAYSYGPKRAVQVVEEFAGIEVSHYAEIYFKGFSKLVDDLGGVEVDVPQLASYKGVTIQPGKQVLNGEQALTLARVRKSYSDGDFTRTKCQRLLVQALVTKVLSQDPTQLPSTIDSISECFKTDMPLQDIANLALSMQGMTSDSFYSGMAPSTTGMLGEVSYVFTYTDQWKLLMQKASQGEKPKLTKKEQEICGLANTRDGMLDMSVPLSEATLSQLQSYWDSKDKKAKNAKKEEISSQESSSTGSETSDVEQGSSTSNTSPSNSSGAAGNIE